MSPSCVDFVTRREHDRSPKAARTWSTRTYPVSEEPTGRNNLRVSERQERVLRAAADLTGETLTGFLLAAATERPRTSWPGAAHRCQCQDLQAFPHGHRCSHRGRAHGSTLREEAQPDTYTAILEPPRSLELLAPHHVVHQFDCGAIELDAWLKRSLACRRPRAPRPPTSCAEVPPSSAITPWP